MLMAGASLVLLILVMIILARQYQQCWQMHQQALLALVDMLSFFVLLYVSPEVTVTSLHPSRLCRLAVFSIKPTLLSLQRTCIRPRRVTTLSQPSPLRITVRKPR